MTHPTANTFKWLRLPSGKYFGLNVPVLFFTDPNYFYDRLGEDRFHGKLGHQAIAVAGRAQHIKPPRISPDDWEFVIKLDRRSKLKTVSVARKAKQPIPDSSGLIRLDHLNVAIIREFGRYRRDATQIVFSFLRNEFFGGTEPTERERSCELFFENDKNFELTCDESHCLYAWFSWRRRATIFSTNPGAQ